jgi:hypothetical protein
MMIMMSALEWVQSFQGITTISIGGISLGGIAGFLVFAVRSGGKMRGVKDLVQIVKESKILLDEERELTKVYKESSDKKDLEIAKQSEVNNLLLKGMSIVIAASGGIDTVSKIEMVNDMKNARDVLSKEVVTAVKQTATVVKEEAKEQSIQVLDKAIEQAATVINKYSKK